MTRRFLLQGLLLGLWSRVAEASHRLSGQLRAIGARLTAAASEPASADGGTLSATELASLLAFAEVIAAGRVMSPPERQYVAEHIEKTAKRVPRELAELRTGARLLDQLADQPLSSLGMAERAALLARHRLDIRVARSGDDTGPFAAQAPMVRSRIAPLLIEGFWSSPAGWGAVGYHQFPGRCGELTRYTRREA